MKKKLIAMVAGITVIAGSMFGLAGCSGATSPDVDGIKGEWQIENTDPVVTTVFTDTEWKLVGSTYTYTLDTSKKELNFEQASNADMKGTATYEFNEDYTQLTITQQNDSGEEQSQVFDKISSDTSAAPTVGGEADDDNSANNSDE